MHPWHKGASGLHPRGERRGGTARSSRRAAKAEPEPFADGDFRVHGAPGRTRPTPQCLLWVIQPGCPHFRKMQPARLRYGRLKTCATEARRYGLARRKKRAGSAGTSRIWNCNCPVLSALWLRSRAQSKPLASDRTLCPRRERSDAKRRVRCSDRHLQIQLRGHLRNVFITSAAKVEDDQRVFR
jgi:hypothetical protein